ncbi:hypothetical protein Ferp_0659 [Ferroglobus placidus DSM 10642]|uniref:Uncharacterized protein n=1 Tax=Ferroglobus placidus (strain DSM 10642 / AEDII12DO) TaxID=589924 RepID=D3S3J7_FERPA|nr:hypothetical protein [Ferroglobus placidus]ADC64830.1 hypothetical protein Ferp_0659 [Ferroglobus placidus DSM 10642]
MYVEGDTLIVDEKIVEGNLTHKVIRFNLPCKVKGFVKAEKVECVNLEVFSFIQAEDVRAAKHIFSYSYIKAGVISAGGFIKAREIFAREVEAEWYIEAEKIRAGKIEARKSILAKSIEAEKVIAGTTVKAEEIKCSYLKAWELVAKKAEVERMDVKKLKYKA